MHVAYHKQIDSTTENIAFPRPPGPIDADIAIGNALKLIYIGRNYFQIRIQIRMF